MTDQRDLHIPQGATWPGLSWPLYDPADGTTLLDLTGWSARSQIRPDPDSSTVHWTWDSTPAEGEGTVTLVGGHVGLNLTDEQSELFTWRTASGYDLEATRPDGEKLIVATGRVYITRNYTKET